MVQLNKELAEIERIANRNKNEAYESFKKRNAIAKIGDIVQDSRQPIIVEKIELSIYGSSVYIIYSGNRVTSKFEPFKRYDRSYVTQGSSFKVLKSN